MEKGEVQARDMSGKNKSKILVIEDDPVAIAILQSRLKAKNYRVIVANTGEEGIKLAHQHIPDLILMDMVLPGMHGLEATIRLKNDPKTKNIPIFAVTAMGSSEFVEACHQDGICVFIKKPYDFRELLAHIQNTNYQYNLPDLGVCRSTYIFKFFPKGSGKVSSPKCNLWRKVDYCHG